MNRIIIQTFCSAGHWYCHINFECKRDLLNMNILKSLTIQSSCCVLRKYLVVLYNFQQWMSAAAMTCTSIVRLRPTSERSIQPSTCLYHKLNLVYIWLIEFEKRQPFFGSAHKITRNNLWCLIIITIKVFDNYYYI